MGTIAAPTVLIDPGLENPIQILQRSCQPLDADTPLAPTDWETPQAKLSASVVEKKSVL